MDEDVTPPSPLPSFPSLGMLLGSSRGQFQFKWIVKRRCRVGWNEILLGVGRDHQGHSSWFNNCLLGLTRGWFTCSWGSVCLCPTSNITQPKEREREREKKRKKRMTPEQIKRNPPNSFEVGFWTFGDLFDQQKQKTKTKNKKTRTRVCVRWVGGEI